MMFALLLPLFVASASAIVCTPNFCDGVNCPNELLCGNGYVKEKGSLCGCCSTCITYADEGKYCPGVLLGVPSTVECRQGLFCNHKTSRCERVDKQTREAQTCEEKRQEVLDKLQTEHILGLEPPTCDTQGNYAAVQCIENTCHCVTEDGSKLKNYLAIRSDRAHMTCKCAREEDKLQHVIGKRVSCKSNGNYAAKQCVGSACFCVEEMEGNQVGESVHISQHNNLNC